MTKNKVVMIKNFLFHALNVYDNLSTGKHRIKIAATVVLYTRKEILKYYIADSYCFDMQVRLF